MKPSEADADESGCGRRNFFCGRKGKFGLNCQAISDVCGRILDFSIGLPGTSLDCMAFKGSDLYKQLEGGLLKKGLVLFGDNAYLNTNYMVTSFPNVSSGSKDDYNFYHSQLCIRVECTFGQLVSKWGILRSAILCNITVLKTVALVSCLARLHTFCIDEDIGLKARNCDEEALPMDIEYIINKSNGYVPLVCNDDHDVPIPSELIDSGHHFDDCP